MNQALELFSSSTVERVSFLSGRQPGWLVQSVEEFTGLFGAIVGYSETAQCILIEVSANCRIQMGIVKTIEPSNLLIEGRNVSFNGKAIMEKIADRREPLLPIKDFEVVIT